MNNNTALSLNQIIYAIYNQTDFHEMKENLLKKINALIPCTCISIMMANKNSIHKETCDPLCYPSDYIAMEKRFLRYANEDYTHWIMEKNSSLLIKSSEMMPEEERMKTVLYKKCYEPFGVHYSMDYTIVENQTFLGVLALYRSKDMGDFLDEEIFLIKLLGEHLSMRFYQESTKVKIEKKTIDMIPLIKRYRFTERESEIVELILHGQKNEQIIELLCISKTTLKKHLQNIYKKTGVFSRVQLLTLPLQSQEEDNDERTNNHLF